MRLALGLVTLFLLVFTAVNTRSVQLQSPRPAVTPESRAVAFLVREVPAWSKNNGCFSCHNNGDAARALFLAEKKGYRVPPEALQDTTAWIRNPQQWDKNKGDPGFSDKRLADIQFASSLLAAIDAGQVKERFALEAAAHRLIADQDADGSWKIDAGNRVGSPATYGTTLATVMALKTLRAVNSHDATRAAKKAIRWLQNTKVNSVTESAALLLAPDNGTKEWLRLREECLTRVLKGQSRDGGWGPYAEAPAEPYDTSLALLALAHLRHSAEYKEGVSRGRKYLIGLQEPVGGWPATTRPPGGNSYAQRISTSGWATLALLVTRD